MNVDDIRTLAIAFLVIMAFAGLAGAVMLAFAVRRLRALDIPADATFVETLLFTPLSLGYPIFARAASTSLSITVLRLLASADAWASWARRAAVSAAQPGHRH